MARALLSHRLTNQAGDVQPYTSVLILEIDGVTPLTQTLYAEPTGGTVRANPLQSDTLGMVVAYADVAQRAIARVVSGVQTIDTVIHLNDDPADLTSAPIALDLLAVPASGHVLQSNGTAVIGGLVTNANIDAAAAIAHSKLAASTAHFVVRAAGGGTMGAGLLTNDNLAAAAAIAVTKLAHVGAGNVLRSNGTTNVGGKVALGDLTTTAVTTRPTVVVGTTNPTTASATPVALADPVASINSFGGDLDVYATASFFHDTTALAVFILYLRLDGGAWVTIGNAGAGAINQRVQVSGFHRFTGVSGTPAAPVAHGIEMGWSHGGGATGTSPISGRRIKVTEMRA